MCEAIVFLVTKGKERELMRDVLTLEAQDDRLVMANLLGDQKEVHAKIKNIDFEHHKVILEEIH